MSPTPRKLGPLKEKVFEGLQGARALSRQGPLSTNGRDGHACSARLWETRARQAVGKLRRPRGRKRKGAKRFLGRKPIR